MRGRPSLVADPWRWPKFPLGLARKSSRLFPIVFQRFFISSPKSSAARRIFAHSHMRENEFGNSKRESFRTETVLNGSCWAQHPHPCQKDQMSELFRDSSFGRPGGGIPGQCSSRISVLEIARRLAVGRQAVYAMLEQKLIPGIRFGRRWIITRHAYELWERTCGMRAGTGLPTQPEVTVLN
jgi:excisionase family DNA binding protein